MKWAYGAPGVAGGAGIDPLRDQKKSQQFLDWLKIAPEKRDAWQKYATEDPTGLQALFHRANLFAIEHSEEEGIKDLLNTLPTPTMVAMEATLRKLEEETYATIITGQKPLTAFDDFVVQWKKLGGDKIIGEVNTWWKSKK
jgi:hypothetical protein